MFATHYHSLLTDWEFDPRVKLGHMNCLVSDCDSSRSNGDNSNNDNVSMVEHDEHHLHHGNRSIIQNEEVTFLYKLTDGSSPRSYGINVAKLAGLPSAVIALALQQSKMFEDKMHKQNDSKHHQQYHWHIDKIKSVYERLVSLACSTISVAELSSVAMDMWNRYHQMKTMNNDARVVIV